MRERIAPLQLSTLASFPTWGSSKGASRASLTSGKNNNCFELILKLKGILFEKFTDSKLICNTSEQDFDFYSFSKILTSSAK